MLLVWQVNCLYYSFSAITCLYHLLWLAYTLHCSFSLAIYLIKRFVIILHSFTNFLTTSRISSDETIGWSRICIEIDFWGVQFNSKWNRTREREMYLKLHVHLSSLSSHYDEARATFHACNDSVSKWFLVWVKMENLNPGRSDAGN